MSDILSRLQDALQDRYGIQRELGRGGMATVYLATDLKHEREVAIKVFHPELSATMGPERFDREIKFAAKLQHPNILTLFDSGSADGLGGTTKSFSPFGAVDTLLILEAIPPQTLTGAPGSAVPVNDLPAVRLRTPTGKPAAGLAVTFSLTSTSDGSITGTTQVTNASGLAELGGWTLGTDLTPDGVIATVTPIPGTGVQANGQVFVATPTAPSDTLTLRGKRLSPFHPVAEQETGEPRWAPPVLLASIQRVHLRMH